MKYLDPKADLTFKRVFGEHPDLVISFLNAMLPFDKDEEIKEIKYLPTELVPHNPLRKDSIVDVRCIDARGRQFLVEMQMIWSKEFMSRVLFNSSKAYVRQLDKNERYDLLQPVYSLNIVNEIFESDLKEYYHYYSIVNLEHTDRVIDGLHLVFIELPKFTPHTYNDKKMQVLWLRYLTEIGNDTNDVPQDLISNSEIKKAVDVIEESAFTPAQLEGYDHFWDVIRTEKTLMHAYETRGMSRGMEKGMKQGMEKGMEKGRQEGIEQGRQEGENRIKKTVKNMASMNMSVDVISQVTGLSQEEVKNILG